MRGRRAGGRWRFGGRRVAVGIAVAAVVAVGGCAAGSTAAVGSADSAGSAGSGTVGGREIGPAGVGDSDLAAAPPGTAAAPAVGGAGQDQPVPPAAEAGRSLVRTAELAVAVTDPAGQVPAVRAAALRAGGLVAQEDSGGPRPAGSDAPDAPDPAPEATLVLRVPADALDRVTDELAGLGAVRSRSSQVVDVTDQVADTGARLASQQAAVARIRALLGEADSIGDVVAVESELVRREAELDAVAARVAVLQGQVALATLTVRLVPVDAPVVAATPPGFLDGLAAGWSALLAFGVGLGAVIGAVLPFLPVVAIVVVPLLVARRRRAGRVAPVGASGPGPQPGPGG